MTSSNGLALTSPILSGIMVTPQSALTLTAAYSAINVISRDLCRLPCNVYKRLEQDGKEVDSTHPVHDLLRVEPNPEMPSQRWLQAQQGHVLGWGNGYSEIVRDGRGTPLSLWPLHPGDTKAKRTDKKKLFYEDEKQKKKYLPENVLHFAGLGFDGISGYSPVTLARQAIGLGIGAEEFGASLFGNGAVPKGFLKTAQKLSPDARRKLREQWEAVHGGTRNANRVAVLEQGLDWTDTQINPDDAQFLATRQFQVLEVARMYNLPPHKIGDYSQSHLANVEESNLDYITTTLAFWLIVYESELNRKLLTRDDRKTWFIEFDMSSLLRGNTSARVAYYTALRDRGILNADEIRNREGLNPIGKALGGDKYLIGVNLTTLAMAGEKKGIDDLFPEPAPKTGVVDTSPDPENQDPEPDGGALDGDESQS